ncbi:Hypp3064 [Branchiostoma lanceolatum]|uniref:Hypp3064 protein n=1 Tax=Branchiostoma lanceolatum TaxID=7740 RepID=A0A8K0ESL4_BRALA|nr:Hypp3064 [Branchiostoma lanceolatum]
MKRSLAALLIVALTVAIMSDGAEGLWFRYRRRIYGVFDRKERAVSAGDESVMEVVAQVHQRPDGGD